ncbi:DegT/DnrJ/EryC1/StrS family aminotransferase [Kitasatospora viridis]|uniref:dTDP-4-amino-4,6-dideoxygalactose transaminase n=1 Tax=Kitasatospora viridis TaxID=281105 RepID=A0A561T691_9ACTN|nr:DegT/DnrJ/EryC1/StrS family aminotransferase [Kitasatospora viridis]TWF82631.1 dTDP-4-amino-4,6-dideoxygalactose transaminase [Kitasatospora viridis]
MRVPRFDAAGELVHDGPLIGAALTRVLASGRFIAGAEVDAFEREAAGFLGARHAVSVGSGTDALTIALQPAADRHPGGEVVTSPLTFAATASAIVRVGLRPRFADVDPDTLTLRPDLAAEATGPRTAAVLPVHLYGRAVDVTALRSAVGPGTPIVEDACQAFGARDAAGRACGTLGDAAAFSFFPSKPLGALGDGGLITTGDAELADEYRLIARHGCREQYRTERVGFNSRLDALQAAVLRVKLARVDQGRRRRAQIAALYAARLDSVPGLRLPADAPGHAWHAYTVRIAGGRRDTVLARLRARGIDAAVQYPVPLHRMAPFADPRPCPVAERACAELLCLPIWSGLGDDRIDYVAQELRDALRTAPVA